MRTGLKFCTMLIAATLSGCGDGSTPAAASPDAPWLLADMPAGAIPVSEAKRAAREGEQIVVRGRVGGRRDPMSTDVAVFVMMDPAVPHCKDGCKAPWDYCCETPETIIANSATVQLVDESGKPLRTDLARCAVKPLDEVVVVGTVGPRPTDEVFVIQASGLHRLID